MNGKEAPKHEIKSIIIDSELAEWEEWGNRWFGHDQPTDDLYGAEDLKPQRDKNKRKQ